jgi:S-adenosylmethionine decarboxylase
MHLVIDGHGCASELLSDTEVVREFLDKYPEAINMTKIMTPHVQTYNGPVPEDGGVSGFVIIAESHISVHTFPDRGYLNVDVFSCKEFDSALAEAEIKCYFGIQRVDSRVIDRGLEHLDPVNAVEVVSAEREAVQQTL